MQPATQLTKNLVQTCQGQKKSGQPLFGGPLSWGIVKSSKCSLFTAVLYLYLVRTFGKKCYYSGYFFRGRKPRLPTFDQKYLEYKNI
jgi:hypothetical protein